jgi:hypothetical protein
MTKHLIIGVLIGASVFGEIGARDIRNPLPLWWGPYHWITIPKETEGCWNVDAWGAGYVRSARDIFRDRETTKTENLDAAFFNQEDFVGVNAFPPGEFDPLNPFLQFSVISPRVSYNERGAFFGITIDKVFGCDCEWNLGLRATMPYRDVETELDSCCANFENGSLEQVRQLENERVQNENGGFTTINKAFAYRMDFLASLFQTVNGPNQQPLIKFFDPTVNSITIDTIAVSDNNNNPVHLFDRSNGTVPPPPFTLRQSVVNTLPFLGANGAPLGNNQRARFQAGVDYTPFHFSPANLRQWWLVPTGNNISGPNTFAIVADARTIENDIESLILTFQNTSAVAFFQHLGFDFNTQRTIGVGDLNLELYLHRYWCDFCGELLLGVRAPTGKKINNPNLIFKQPTGNNGHWEPYIGFIAGWEGLDWLHIKGDGRYYYVVSAKEKIAATFRGATVKGLGPTVDADISWQWFIGNVDFTFYPRCNPMVGIDLGYQVYVKGKDRVDFILGHAIDLLGNPAVLDPGVAEKRTDIVAHRIRAEIFHQACNAEIFGGWMHTFAGKNAMKDTDLYLGLMIYF